MPWGVRNRRKNSDKDLVVRTRPGRFKPALESPFRCYEISFRKIDSGQLMVDLRRS